MTKAEQKKVAKLGHTIIGKLQYLQSICSSDMKLQEATKLVSYTVKKLEKGEYK